MVGVISAWIRHTSRNGKPLSSTDLVLLEIGYKEAPHSFLTSSWPFFGSNFALWLRRRSKRKATSATLLLHPCVPEDQSRHHVWWRIQLRGFLSRAVVCASIIVDPGVIESLDGTMQCLKIVWKCSSAFLSSGVFSFSCLSTRAQWSHRRAFCDKVVLYYEQLPPVTSLPPSFNSFGNSVVLDLAFRLLQPGSHFQREKT